MKKDDIVKGNARLYCNDPKLYYFVTSSLTVVYLMYNAKLKRNKRNTYSIKRKPLS